MYEGWRISRWETPVVDLDRLLMVSLTDADQELVLLLEDARTRDRWRVRWRGRYPAYRNIDESYRVGLWQWLHHSGQRCGSTFLVQETPVFASWETGYLEVVEPRTRHFVIATDDDVVEVLSQSEPIWETAEAPEPEAGPPGKARHLYRGEDDAEIDREFAEIMERQKHHQREGVTITPSQVVPLLLETCPSARDRWAEHVADWKGEEPGAYNDVSVIAHHIVDSYARGVTTECAPLFRMVERILEQGDDQARQLATTGVLEDIHVISTHHPFGPEVFLQWLGPRSQEAWEQIEALWAAGGGSLAGVLRVEHGLRPRRKWWQFWK